MTDICERLVRFAGKVCISTDTEVEAAATIEALRIANQRLKHEAYLAAVSETCDVEETGDYYSGFCDGVQAAAAAVERMK